MPKTHGYVFVLWGDRFTEVAATIFVCKLREAGLKVRVVGLTPQPIQGAYGLALVPDMMLDQALLLATQVICLIIPYASSSIRRLTNDPRLREFFGQVYANHAKVVISELNQDEIVELALFPTLEADWAVIYPTQAELTQFVQDLADVLRENY